MYIYIYIIRYIYIYIYIYRIRVNSEVAIIEGSLEVKLPTIWTDEKQRWEKRRVEERREEERRWQKRKSQKKEAADAWKGRKVAKHCVFPMICGSGGSKSRLANFAEMILHDRCSTSYDLAKIARRSGTRLSALHSTFHFWRKSRRFLLCCQVQKLKKSYLICFWCCQLRQMWKSRRRASFSSLQIDR